MKKTRISTVLFLSLCLLFSGVLPGTTLQTKAKSGVLFTFVQAKALAFANSSDYRKLSGSIALKQVEYIEAVKSIGMKRIDMATFRWSPLLDFQFPQQPDLAEAYEWQYKPVQIQTEIQGLLHELGNVKYKLAEETAGLYMHCYTDQEKIAFSEERLQVLEETTGRTGARVRTGEAAQADLDKMEKETEKLKSDVSLFKRDFESQAAKLAELVKLDVSQGVTFEDAFVKAEIPRDRLADLTKRTLEEDQGFYQTKLDESLGKISLELNERLLQSKFGAKMNVIKPYLNQAKRGQELDGDSFKAAYTVFLDQTDAPWQGKKRILFIKIPKEWFKGAVDGIRYVEDEPYALYTAAMEYAELKRTREQAEKELRQQVADRFEAVVTAKNAYDVLAASIDSLRREVEKSESLNRAGKMSYEELSTIQTEYATAQIDALDALETYGGLLFGFDRLTCGGITDDLEPETTGILAAGGGKSYLEAEETEGASYYLRSRIEDNLFEFGISVPGDFSIAITDFELWVDGTKVGARSGIGGTIRHLTLALDGIGEASVRFYNGDDYVDTCTFDPMVVSGPLTIKGGYRKKKTGERAVATYKIRKNSVSGLTEFTLHKTAGEEIACYRLLDMDGTPLLTDGYVEEGQTFSYLSVLDGEAWQLKVELFDGEKNRLYTGRLETGTLKVMAGE